MTNETETAVLAGGCFWGMQDLIRKRPGVVTTRVGYTGGDVVNATYRHHEGHAEAIEIVFDPSVISYRDILAFFFQIHDPTTVDRQGNDVGSSYRSAIFYVNDEQRQVAEDVIADVDASGLWPGKVVTEVTPAGAFWEAEPEHQDYLEKLPQRLHLSLPATELGPAAAQRQRDFLSGSLRNSQRHAETNVDGVARVDALGLSDRALQRHHVASVLGEERRRRLRDADRHLDGNHSPAVGDLR